jgi:hypoxanthine phosphoribosyltransferase
MRVTEFDVVTWNRMYNVLLSLARKIIKSGFVPDVVVGVSRGGWIPARVLCDLLSAPALANIGVEYYSGVGERKRQPRLTQPLSAAVSGKSVLVVDEVADTGKSLKLVEDHVFKEGAKDVRTVTLYTKPWSVVEPNYHEKKTSCWIVFPWETKETIRSIAAGSKWEKRKELDDLEHARLSARQAQRFLNKILEEKYRNH